jgi:hypothetical protein
VLARLAHELTILGRNPYWFPSLNEIQHSVTAQLSALLTNNPKCYPDEELVSVILKKGDQPDLRESISGAFQRSLASQAVVQTAPAQDGPPQNE